MPLVAHVVPIATMLYNYAALVFVCLCENGFPCINEHCRWPYLARNRVSDGAARHHLLVIMYQYVSSQ